MIEEQQYFNDNIKMLNANFPKKYLLIHRYNLIAAFNSKEEAINSRQNLNLSEEDSMIIYCDGTEQSESEDKRAWYNVAFEFLYALLHS